MVKLDCEIYEPGKRAATTEKLQEAIKNCELSSLDLLVREMVQNSLDAALDEDRTKAVSVLFRRGDFNVNAFANCLGGDFKGTKYSNLLLNYLKHAHVTSRYLAIQDMGCVGLDGDVEKRTSRAWKLPFGFYDGQSADSATGGANGVGKVIAFRFGIGFVVYYSKTKDGQSRFVIAFMDIGSRSVFPGKAMPNGAAWWGRRSQNSRLEVVCVENEPEILSLLQIFNMKPYMSGRSGTTTIIPFFDEDACLREEAGRMPKEHCPWVNDFDSCIRFCVNQWYAPRLRDDEMVFDPGITGSKVPFRWGRSLRTTHARLEMDYQSRKVFSLIRELYDVAVGERWPNDGIKRIICPMRKNAPKQGVFFHGENLGWVAVKKINYLSDEYNGVLPVLCSLVPGHIDEESGESFLGRLGTRRGFMLYCRRHGMIVSYERDWDDICFLRLPKPQEGEFYIGIFVVDSDSTVSSQTIHNDQHAASIDVIFRSFEKTDHYGWPRHALFCRMPFISTLLNQIKVKLASEFRSGIDLCEREPLEHISALLGRFTSAVGPGFGDGPSPSPDGVGGVPGVGAGMGVENRGINNRGHSSKTRGSSASGARIRFEQGSPVYKLVKHQTIIAIPVTIEFSHKLLCATIKCGIVQEGSSAILDADDFSPADLPVRLKSAEVGEPKSLAAVELDKKTNTVVVKVPKKDKVIVICSYELSRKDAAIALICDSAEKRGMR